MKKLLFSLLICASSAAFAQKADFSGNYTINLEKTTFGAAPHGVLPAAITVKQDKDKTTISRNDKEGKLLVTEELKFDGSIFNRTQDNGNKATTSLKWSEDKKGFNLDKKGYNGDGDITNGVKETWTLEDGGKTLILVRDVEQSNGLKYSIKGFYDKK